MPVKLIQVSKDLGIGISTASDYLLKSGHVIDNNPNARISDEQLALLINEFGKNLSAQERERLLTQPAPQPKKPVPPAVKREEKRERPQALRTEIPNELKPRLVTKGKIDLEHPQKTEPKPVKSPQPPKVAAATPTPSAAPAGAGGTTIKKQSSPEVINKAAETKPVIPNPATTTTSSPFRIHTGKEGGPSIKVTGKIDLDAINQSTRPKKKTKEERRKERDAKRPRTAQAQQNADRSKTNGNTAAKSPSAAKPAATNAAGTAATAGKDGKRKRNRIKKDRVDINNTPGVNVRPSNNNNNNSRERDRKRNLRKPVVKAVSDEDVQKQVKETLARLTSKKTQGSKGAKYRRDKRDAAHQREHELQERAEEEKKVLKLTEFVTANDLASMMDIPVTKVIATCMNIDIMVSINQRLDADTINLVAEEFGFRTEYVSADVVEAIKTNEVDNEADWQSRPPIVTVMGHVDHGKTSLLDNIRKTNVIAGEAGGITQHIGAYNVRLPRTGRHITFLDTPGHEAFTAMRARGAKVTDIAIIIVAADDNVMPQTIEAINHAAAAGVPIVFAINKIDKPGADPDKIKAELAKMNYLVEDWGGKFQCQEISAKKGTGVEELLEKVLLEADLLNLKANPKLRATGSIIESSLDKGRGYVATILVENGTLRTGDIVLAGTHYGRIKAMFNERNQKKEEAAPSEPVLILGLNGAPQAGDTFNVLETEQEAREIANRREQLQRELGLRTQKRLTLAEMSKRLKQGNFKELNIIVKGDVDGSVEALSDSFIRLSNEEVQVNVIHKAVGQISESDVVLAAASDAIVIGFQVRPSLAARKLAEKEGVEIRLYSVIYDAIDEVKSAMEGMLAPEMKEEVVGLVEVREVFKITKVGTVAGGMVKEGKVKRGNKVRLIRDGIVLHSGELGSLKRFKDDVKEVNLGLECGLNIAGYNDIQAGDLIEAYEEVQVKKTLQAVKSN